MKEAVKLLKFFPERNFLHIANQEKGWESLGVFQIAYYDLSLNCSLIRGANNNYEKSYFYFLELPCLRLKNKTGKWIKKNFFNFKSVDISNQFQDAAFSIILEDYPELFDEVFLKDRLRLKNNNESQFNDIKARDKSKFNKDKK